jgi:hypothetical protein
MKLKHLLYISLAVLLLVQARVYPQFSFQLLTEQEYNSNPFRSRIPESNFISAYDLTLQYEPGNMGIMYNGTLINFNSSADRNFFWHMAGIWSSFDSSAVSFSFEQRINLPAYSYFDYFELALNYEHRLMFLGVNVNIYPSITYSSYKNISILDNVKSTLSLSLNKSFETKTTLILGGAVNHKIYTQPNKTDMVQIVNDSNQVINTLIEGQNATTLTQLTSFGRIAQSVTSTTGVAFQFTNRKILNGLASSIKELNLTYGDESEIFDDPVNYEGNSFLVEVTQILFDDLQIKLGYSSSRKAFPSQGVYDVGNTYYTGTERVDSQNIYSVSAKKSFSLSASLDLELGLKYYYMKNSSNSYLYKYNSNALNFNVNLSF